MDHKTLDSSSVLDSTSITSGVSSLSLSSKTKHRLACGFTFWYLKKDSGRGVLQTNYQEQIKNLATFHTVEDFWAYYSHLIRPNDLTISADYNLFREGIVPMWEDATNRNGGKWVVRLKKGMASRCWEDAVLALIGDEFHLGDEICGVVLSTKFQDDILSFWTKTADDRELTYSIRETIKRVLGIPSNSALEYKQHQQALKHSLNSPPASDRTIDAEVYEKRGDRDERDRDTRLEREPSAGRLEREPSAGRLEREPSAGRMEREPSAGRMEREPSAGRMEREPSGGRMEREPSGSLPDRGDKERGGDSREPRSWDRYSREKQTPTRNWEQRGVGRDWDRPRNAQAPLGNNSNGTSNGAPLEKDKDDGWQQVPTRSKRRDERDDWPASTRGHE